MSEDEYSDLTDLDSDEHDEYKITHALSIPRPATFTTQALFDQIHNNDINLEPEYQRDVVWSEAKQIGLIDSIYRNFYVPPVIFTVQMNEEGAETRTCIDGKQRLTSIHKFMDGLIPHRDQFTGKRYWYKDTQTMSGGKKKLLLHPRLRKLFATKQIVCMEYQNLSEEAEREIFQRVQLGMALTPAEKLQVIKTNRSDFVRELQNIYMKEEGSLANGALQWDTSRGGDYRGLAQALYCIDKLDTGMKNVGMPQLEKWLSMEQRLERTFVHQVRDTFRIFADLAGDVAHNNVFREPVKTSPVEFVLFAVFIYAHKDKATVAQLASGISKMRIDVRKEHVDIRMNSKVMKTMAEFIMKWKPTTIPGDAGAIAGHPPGSGSKRKRANKDKDGDDYMDSDEDDGGDADQYREEQARKAARKSVNAVASSSSSSTAPSSKRNGTVAKIKIKIEPKSTPLGIPPAPPTDRLAALRRAKEATMQQQAQRIASSQSSQVSTLSTEGSAPQMLPSPGQPFSFPSSTPSNPPPPSSLSSSSQGSQGRLPLPSASARLPPPPPLTSSSIDSTLMATMMQSRIGPPPSSSRMGASNLPPPPSSAGSVSSATGDRRSDYDRDRGPPPRRDSGQFDSRRGR